MGQNQQQKLKLYKSAVLPFIGQKRNFVKHYISVLEQNIDGDGDGWTIVDAFGGSGLLSHVSKRIKPNATVIYNDYDDYSNRLKNIADTNRLREQLQLILIKNDKQKMSESLKQRVINCIKNFEGFVDFKTISTWLLFSGQYVDNTEQLNKKAFYNRIKATNYELSKDYLKGLNVVKKDYVHLLSKYANNNKCLFVLDPPYICTEQGMYANDTYFGMIEFLKLMRLVRPPFVFFSSTRSELINYLECVIDNKQDNYKSFINYKRQTIKASCNYSAKYEDNLVYKF